MTLINTFRENTAAIRAFGVDDLAGFLLFYIGVCVVDLETRRPFESSAPQDGILPFNIYSMESRRVDSCFRGGRINVNMGKSAVGES